MKFWLIPLFGAPLRLHVEACVGCAGHAPPLRQQTAPGKLAGPNSHVGDRGHQAASSHAAECQDAHSPLQNGKPNSRLHSRGDSSRPGLGALGSLGSSNRSEGREFFRRCCPALCEPAHNEFPAGIPHTARKHQSMLGLVLALRYLCAEVPDALGLGAELHAGRGPDCQMKPSAYSYKPSRT